MARLKMDKEGTITTKIVDAESDLIIGNFNHDGCIQLDTKKYSYITLSIENLYEMISMIERAEKMYEKSKV